MLIEKISCPKCGSSRTPALQVYLGDLGLSGYCFSCRKYFSDPYKGVVGKGVTRVGEEEMESLLKKAEADEKIRRQKYEQLSGEIENLPWYDESIRGIIPATLKTYGVKIEPDGFGNIYHHYYPYYKNTTDTTTPVPCGYKVRAVNNKDFYSIGNISGSELFGQNIAERKNEKYVIVVEGELDAMSTYQMLRSRGKTIDVVSISTGAGVDSIKSNWEFLNGYEKILILFDQDIPGQEAAHEACQLFEPKKALNVTLPRGINDPNELLQSSEIKNPAKVMADQLRSATEVTPDGIVSVQDIIEQALEPRKRGLTLPWESLTKVTDGIRTGELWTWCAGSGIGKSSAARYIAKHLMINHNEPVGFLMLEERAKTTLQMLASMISGVMYHKEHEVEDKAKFRKEVSEYSGLAHFYDSFGAVEWETVKQKIRYFAKALGIRYVVVDNITALTAHSSDEMGETSAIMSDLASMVNELGINIQLISHLRKNPSGKPFEEGAQITVADLKGSSSINFWSYYVFALERNSQSEDETVRNTTTVRVLKDRINGNVGEKFSLSYDKKTGIWEEIDSFPDTNQSTPSRGEEEAF